jgi:hypothetical protein
MKISSAFTPDYLDVADLGGHAMVVTVSHVCMEDVDGKRRPILYFENLKSGLVITKAFAQILAGQLGDETELWAGAVLELSPPSQVLNDA